MRRPCLQPDCPNLTDKRYRGYCPSHRKTTAQRGYGPEWQQQSRLTIAAHVSRYGWTCPGDAHHAAHETTDLTLDHVRRGDARVTQVLCRAANTAKKNRGY